MNIADAYNPQTKQWDDTVGYAFDGSQTEAKAPGSERAKGEALGQSEFFKLLTTQLASQDPLEPMDDTAFIAQMASFSTLEMQSNLNKSFDSYSAEQEFIGAQAMIGKKVSLLVEGEHIEGIAQGVEKDGDTIRVSVGGRGYDIKSVNRVAVADSSSKDSKEAFSGDEAPPAAEKRTSLPVTSSRQVESNVSDGGPTQ